MYHYYMFYKPVGCITARRDEKHPTVMDYFQSLQNENLSPVGRLDLETEGLLLLTDDGKWNQQMTHPNYKKEKCYEFFVTGEMTEEKRQQLEQGVWVEGAKEATAPAKVVITSRSVFCEVLPQLPLELQKRYGDIRPDYPVVKGTITITEGKKRQIRRMMKVIGCRVVYLKRISMGEFVLDSTLQPGEWKELFLEQTSYVSETVD